METFFICIPFILMAIIYSSGKNHFCSETVCFCADIFTADCSNRNLREFPDGLPLKIKTLVLSGNNFSHIRNDTMEPILALNITKLLLNNCHIKSISEHFFERFSNLVFLDLAYNELNLTNIYHGIKSLRDSNIQVLNISGIFFMGRLLPGEIFRTFWMRELQEIVLRSCGIRYFSFKSFKLLLNIRKIDFGSNLITNYVLPEQPFRSIRELNFTDNYFEKVPKFCLNGTRNLAAFPNLRKLHIAVNTLVNTDNFISQGFCLKQVIFLNISQNVFKEIALYSFYRMGRLQTLVADNLRGVALDNMSLSSRSLQRLSIGRLVKTRDRDFTKMFDNCPNIKVLNIMNTDLSVIAVTKMLAPLRDVSSLSFVNCEVNEIMNLNNFTKLAYIDFRNNRIKKIQARVFQNLTNLKRLDLSNNRLNNINRSFLPGSLWEGKDFTLDVSLNPLDCGCQLEWFRIWIENNVNRVIGYPGRYICDSPSELKDKSLSNFDPASECHRISPYIILICVSLALLSLVILSIYLLRKFRWDIKYYIYICKNKKPSGYKRFTDDEEFLYDAFVAYNTKDRYWIMSELVQMVERNEKHKLCLHERDIIPGGIYVDDILESIDTSRKFILVLSNNFMDDQWCMYEAALANHTLADGEGHKLLLILLEDIRSEHINRSLKVLLKSTSYVEWTKNKNGLKIFWQTIKQFMKK